MLGRAILHWKSPFARTISMKVFFNYCHLHFLGKTKFLIFGTLRDHFGAFHGVQNNFLEFVVDKINVIQMVFDFY